MTGTGGTTSGNGITINTASSIESTLTGGNITLLGTSTTASDAVIQSASSIESTGGNIDITGNSDTGIGVNIIASATIDSNSSGTITITGTTDGASTGVTVSGGATDINSEEGDITITGTGSVTGSTGVSLASGSIDSTGTLYGADIFITGTGGGTGDGISWGSLSLSSVDGDITLDGDHTFTGGGAGVAGSSFGSLTTTSGTVLIDGAAVGGGDGVNLFLFFAISSTGSGSVGSVTINGVGGGDFGAVLGLGSSVSVVDADLFVTGLVNGLTSEAGVELNNSSLTSTSGGDISVTGTGSLGASITSDGVLFTTGSISSTEQERLTFSVHRAY